MFAKFLDRLNLTDLCVTRDSCADLIRLYVSHASDVTTLLPLVQLTDMMDGGMVAVPQSCYVMFGADRLIVFALGDSCPLRRCTESPGPKLLMTRGAVRSELMAHRAGQDELCTARDPLNSLHKELHARWSSVLHLIPQHGTSTGLNASQAC